MKMGPICKKLSTFFIVSKTPHILKLQNAPTSPPQDSSSTNFEGAMCPLI